VTAGGDYRGFLDWSTPGVAGRIERSASIAVSATWRNGKTVFEQSATVKEPSCLARGDTTTPVDLSAPSQSGRYDLTVNADGVTAATTVTVVSPPAGPAPNDPRPTMQLVRAQLRTRTTEAGGVVFVRADWRLQHRTLDNYLLRLEVVDHQGRVVASSTVDPFDGALETGQWLPDETVRLGQSAILPRTLPLGSYTVRLLVRFADGAVWKMAGPDNNDHDSVDVGTVRVG
jgi:hypothetical protein